MRCGGCGGVFTEAPDPHSFRTNTYTHCDTLTSFTSRFLLGGGSGAADGRVGVEKRLRSFIVSVRMKEGPLRAAP